MIGLATRVQRRVYYRGSFWGLGRSKGPVDVWLDWRLVKRFEEKITSFDHRQAAEKIYMIAFGIEAEGLPTFFDPQMLEVTEPIEVAEPLQFIPPFELLDLIRMPGELLHTMCKNFKSRGGNTAALPIHKTINILEINIIMELRVEQDINFERVI